MIAMLMAAATAFLITIFGTPLLIAQLRKRGIGQQIRDDGPIEHPHAAKAGTPTMGGLAIVVAVIVGYVMAHVRHKSVAFSSSGWTLLALIVGLALVGWLDDYLGVRARRNLGPAQAGQDARHGRRGRVVRLVGDRFRARLDALVVHAAVGPRPGDGRLVRVRDPHRLRDRERCEPHRRSRRARGGVVDLRVRGVHDHRLHRVPASDALRTAARLRHRAGTGPGDRRGCDVRCLRRLPLVECRAGAHHHGRHRFARDRRGDGRARADRRTPRCSSRFSPASR